MSTHKYEGWPTALALQATARLFMQATRPLYLGEISLEVKRNLAMAQLVVDALVARGDVRALTTDEAAHHGMSAGAVAFCWIGPRFCV